jgi:hypothetical protein
MPYGFPPESIENGCRKPLQPYQTRYQADGHAVFPANGTPKPAVKAASRTVWSSRKTQRILSLRSAFFPFYHRIRALASPAIRFFYFIQLFSSLLHMRIPKAGPGKSDPEKVARGTDK